MILTIIHNPKKQQHQEDDVFYNILIINDYVSTQGQHPMET